LLIFEYEDDRRNGDNKDGLDAVLCTERSG